MNPGGTGDFLVYPVLFLYRHHLELLIKQIIGLALALAEDPDKDSSVVKWVVLAEVLVGAVMYMMTKTSSSGRFCHHLCIYCCGYGRRWPEIKQCRETRINLRNIVSRKH